MNVYGSNPNMYGKFVIVCVLVTILNIVHPSQAEIDFALTSYEVTAPAVVSYRLGEYVIINATVKVKNEGTDDVSSGETNHFDMRLYFSNDMDLEDATMKTPRTGISVDVDESDKLKGDYPGSTYTPPSPAQNITFSANVSMPANNCTKYSHLCASLKISVNTNDGDASNEFKCLALTAQPPLGAGFRDCRPSSSSLLLPSLYNVVILGFLLPILIVMV
ncbi:uncharacterized protein LOC144441452 [Glandiceps talaboti]